MNEATQLSQALDEIANELEPVPALPVPGRRRRRAAETQAVGGEAVIQVVEREGVLHVEEAGLATSSRRRRRGPGRAAIEGEVQYERKFERLDRSQIWTLLENLDKKLTPQRGLRVLRDGGLELLPKVPEHGRILLLIHGTFSESESFLRGFKENPQGLKFVNWAHGHYSHIVTFDHPTLSTSPVLNARRLALLFGDSQADIDVICHSRGGLVTRWWLEVFDRAPRKKRRAVFVGSPLAGTGLASPSNIRGSLSLLSNIGTALGTVSAGIPFLTVLTGIFRVVTSVTSLAAKTPAVDAAIGLVPGLAAQSRVGNNPELKSLRDTRGLAADRYSAVISNFESEKPGWKFWQYFRNIGDRTKDALADLVFEGQNDLVVDTRSMVDLSDELCIPSELVLDFGTTDAIHHTNYFSQPETLEFIEEMLTYGLPRKAAAVRPMETVRRYQEDLKASEELERAFETAQKEAEESLLLNQEDLKAREESVRRRMEELRVREEVVRHYKEEMVARKKSERRYVAELELESSKESVRNDKAEPKEQQKDRQQQKRQTLYPQDPMRLRRTPHIDLSPLLHVTPETIIRVRVFADKQAARSGEESEDIVIDLPPHIKNVNLNTHLLVSPQLKVVGSAIQPLKIDVDKAVSSDAIFKVRVRSRAEIEALMPDLPSVKRASISAVFNCNGRPSGSVTRIVPLDLDFAVPPDSPRVVERIAEGTLQIEPGAKQADLLVQVRTQPIHDGRQFQCWASTPLIETEEENRWEDWNLPDVAELIVRDYMSNFVDEKATPLERLSSLKGAGRALFDAAPANFKSVYWKLVDADHSPKTIAIVSDEPYIPWELMIPHRRRQGKSESMEPLGVACAIGRWVHGDCCTGPQQLPLSNSIVIAPRYSGKNALPHAEEEAEYVLEHFPGLRIEPATLETIDQTFHSNRGSILHLICHGVDVADSTAQAVYLEDDRKLDTTILSGLDSLRNALEDNITLVVINACEVGRPKPALVGLGGFAQTFIELGAGGVVAALWSVRDDLAHEIAMDFYREVLKNPTLPFAEVLRNIRARAYDRASGAEDTYAAYCFYGDPLASAG